MGNSWIQGLLKFVVFCFFCVCVFFSLYPAILLIYYIYIYIYIYTPFLVKFPVFPTWKEPDEKGPSLFYCFTLVPRLQLPMVSLLIIFYKSCCTHNLIIYIYIYIYISGATTSGYIEPGSKGNEGVLWIPQCSSITRTSSSDCFLSYPGYSRSGLIFYSPSWLGKTSLRSEFSFSQTGFCTFRKLIISLWLANSFIQLSHDLIDVA